MLIFVLRPLGISLLCLQGSLNLLALRAGLYPLRDFVTFMNNGYNIKIGNTLFTKS